MNEITPIGKRKLWVTCGYSGAVIGLCSWLLYAGKLDGGQFLQALQITGLLVAAYLGANVAKGVWGKE